LGQGATPGEAEHIHLPAQVKSTQHAARHGRKIRKSIRHGRTR
jgi:hypothetical protein